MQESTHKSMPEKQPRFWYAHLPMWLTWCRVLVIPLIIFCYYYPFTYHLAFTTTLFGLAAFTDWLDGFLARRWNVQSSMGKFLDPTADKLLVTVALVMIAVSYQSVWMTVCIIILLAREIYISALREFMSSVNASGKTEVSFIGKVKTTMQLMGITMLLYGSNEVWGIPWIDIGKSFLVISTILSLISMLQYTLSALPYFLKLK